MKRKRGQAYVEFLLVLPLLLIIVAGVIGFGRLMYGKLAVQAAAWASCRHAVASLDEYRATQQAGWAARYTLNGFSLSPDAAQVTVSHTGQWMRGTPVTVRVCYNVSVAEIPLGNVIAPQQVCASQTMPVNQLKSRW